MAFRSSARPRSDTEPSRRSTHDRAARNGGSDVRSERVQAGQQDGKDPEVAVGGGPVERHVHLLAGPCAKVVPPDEDRARRAVPQPLGQLVQPVPAGRQPPPVEPHPQAVTLQVAGDPGDLVDVVGVVGEEDVEPVAFPAGDFSHRAPRRRGRGVPAPTRRGGRAARRRRRSDRPRPARTGRRAGRRVVPRDRGVQPQRREVERRHAQQAHLGGVEPGLLLGAFDGGGQHLRERSAAELNAPGRVTHLDGRDGLRPVHQQELLRHHDGGIQAVTVDQLRKPQRVHPVREGERDGGRGGEGGSTKPEGRRSEQPRQLVARGGDRRWIRVDDAQAHPGSLPAAQGWVK